MFNTSINNLSSSVYFRISISVWTIAFIGVCLQLDLVGLQRSVTPIYHLAVDHWLGGESLYYGPKGFNYLPVFVPIFIPFRAIPDPLGDILWRLIAWLGLAFGIIKITGLIKTENYGKACFLVTLVSLPLCVSALRNGQSSAHIAACMVLAAWFLYSKNWWAAAISISLTLAFKPLGLPAIGLAVMLFPVIWSRVLIGVIIVFLAPYGFGSVDYVSDQYIHFTININQCMEPTGERTFADLNGALRLFGIEIKRDVYLYLQIISGLILALLTFVFRKHEDAVLKIILFLSLSGCYIMLFTPMNETNSYIMLAPSLGLWTIWLKSRNKILPSWSVIGVALIMSFSSGIVRSLYGSDFTGDYNKSMMPILTIVFLLITLRVIAFELAWIFHHPEVRRRKMEKVG